MPNLLTAEYPNGQQSFDPNQRELTSTQYAALQAVLGLNRTFSMVRPDLSRGYLASFLTNAVAAGGTVSQATLDKIAPHLSRLIASTAWPKIKELWLAVGDTSDLAGLNTARVKLKYVSGAAAAMTNTAFIAGDYTPALALVNTAASGKKFTSDFNPSAQFASQGEVGFATYCFGTGSRGTKNADSAGSAATVAFAGVVGNPGGSDANSNYFTMNGGSRIARISAGTTALTPGMGRYCAVQQTAGVTQAWRGAYLMATIANAAPSGNNSVYAIGAAGGANEFTGSVSGAAFFDPLTATEHGDLTDFFDNVNIALGRAIFIEEVCAVGDSNTFVYGNGPSAPVAPNRWTRALADQLGMAENNQGMAGARINPFVDLLIATPERLTQRMMGCSSRINILAPGVNDIADYSATAPVVLGPNKSASLANLEFAVVSAKLARVPNICLVGVGVVNWAVAKASYPATSYGTVTDTTYGLVADWNNNVQDMATRLEVAYFDPRSVPNVPQSDGLHNNSACQNLIGAALATSLRGQIF